jgi:hypothetical protein
MRRACWLALLVVALAGCGGGGAKSNGVADLGPNQILAQVKKDVANAKSVHIVGSGKTGGTPITLDLQLAAGKGGAGHIEIGGYGFDLVRIGEKLYFKSDHRALQHYAGSAAAQLLAGKWFAVPASSGGFGSFAPFTDLRQIVNQILSAAGPVEKGDETKIDGQKAIALTDTSRRHALRGDDRARLSAGVEGRQGQLGVDLLHVGPAGHADRAEGRDRLREADRRLNGAGIGGDHLGHADRLARA